MWLFLSTEVMFFAGLFASFIVLKSAMPGGMWPENEWVHVKFNIGLLNTALLTISSGTAFLALRGFLKKSKSKSVFWLSLTITLGFAFLFVKGLEYRAKFHLGIHPMPQMRQVYDWPDIHYVSATRQVVETRINRIESLKSAANGASQSLNAEAQEELDRLYTVRSGLIGWTESQLTTTNDPAVQQEILQRFAQQIYCYDNATHSSLKNWLQDDLHAVRDSWSLKDAAYQRESAKVQAVNKSINELESKRRSLEQQNDGISDSLKLEIGQINLEIEQLKKSVSILTTEVSNLRAAMVPLEDRLAFLEKLADARGINAGPTRLGLPLVIPGGGSWMNMYYLMTGIHAIHLLVGIIAFLGCLCLVGSGIGAEVVHNSVLYWHFVDVVWLLLFAVFYW